MKKYRLWISAAIGLLSLSAFSSAAEPGKMERRVTVQGHGKVSAVPDLARLGIAVSEEGTSVEAVTQQVRRKMDAVMKVLKEQGIAEKDLRTQVYRVVPKMEWKNGRSNRIGVTVSNQLEVKIRDLKKIGTVLTLVQDAGANEIAGPAFEIEHPQELERQALSLALQDAKAKAAVLAQAGGASVGEILTIDEGTSYRPGPRPLMAMKAMQLGAPSAGQETISAGEDIIDANITATFSLK